MKRGEAGVDACLDPRLEIGRDDHLIDRPRLAAGDLHQLTADQPPRVIEDHIER